MHRCPYGRRALTDGFSLINRSRATWRRGAPTGSRSRPGSSRGGLQRRHRTGGLRLTRVERHQGRPDPTDHTPRRATRHPRRPSSMRCPRLDRPGSRSRAARGYARRGTLSHLPLIPPEDVVDAVLDLVVTTPDPAASSSRGPASDLISCPQRADAFASP